MQLFLILQVPHAAEQSMRLCQRLLGTMVTLTVAPRDVPAKNMEWIARLHVVPVESEIVARILPHQTSVKTMKNINNPLECATDR